METQVLVIIYLNTSFKYARDGNNSLCTLWYFNHYKFDRKELFWNLQVVESDVRSVDKANDRNHQKTIAFIEYLVAVHNTHDNEIC